MPYCSNCGTELEAGTKFCPSCGTAVGRRRRTSNARPQISQFADTEEQSTEDAVRRGVTNAKCCLGYWHSRSLMRHRSKSGKQTIF